MKALVGVFNQEKALVGAFSVIVQPVVKPMGRFATLSLYPIMAKVGIRQMTGGMVEALWQCWAV